MVKALGSSGMQRATPATDTQQGANGNPVGQARDLSGGKPHWEFAALPSRLGQCN